MDKIELFIKKLSQCKVAEDVDNFYAGRKNIAKAKRANLRLYLQEMLERSPEIMFVAEAPGYNGAKWTGVPFSSESLLMDEEHPIFGRKKGYEITRTGKLANEASAKIVWQELNKYEKLPLIWNIFPFHPHKLGNQNSNRAPRQTEVEQGKEFVQQLLNIFYIKKIAAVGRKAEQGLLGMNLSIPILYVRHPSHGGKNDFINAVNNCFTT